MPVDLVADIRAARRIVVLTGAGMSAESGIATFRDALTGLWSRFDPQTLATREGFKRDPALVWGWYEARRRGVLNATPNAGHLALRDLAAMDGVADLAIVTQNVDNLHERAGSQQVIHLHGSLFAPRCLACAHAYAYAETDGAGQTSPGEPDRPVQPPRCTHCGGPIRPGVVWFGEELPTREWAQAVDRVREADLLLVVGTSGQVYPAASLPAIVEQNGRPVWIIDPDEGLAKGTREFWNSTAAAGLPALVAACARKQH
ncbi:NAD-dependent deacylase [Variovorax sp. J22R24]|uniref:SIR2 family NAD-dependent protein deacylase n=1 Tax=Variovorax gracilis TaxID=3053502 RepID=UPI002578489D|nr:NAD-dependent deacylase [Variovorax sp. J22R24]MDM0108481.1 NAD-dependent deacylase [Variovorax sp. J22R24]